MGQTETTPPLIEACGLEKHYGKTHAVRALSFQVQRGEVVGFLGPNGAGKSTTMKMLTGFLQPSAGHARIGGFDVAAEPLRARALLGYLPENAPLYDDMMVIDFLRFIAALRGVPAAAVTPRLREVCARCGLMDVLGKDIGQLSKGFRQRVGLAQALVHDPALLILDEPTSGLDPNQIIEIRQLIRDLGRDKTVLLSTHILPEVRATCGRVIIISDGSLVADDRPEALTEAAGQGSLIRLTVRPRPRRTVDREQVQAMLRDLPGVHDVDRSDGEGQDTLGFSLRTAASCDPREAIFDSAVSNNLVILDLYRERGSLEDTFRRLTRSSKAANGGTHA